MPAKPSSDRPDNGIGRIFDPRRSLPARAALLAAVAVIAVALASGWFAARALRQQIGVQLGTSFQHLAGEAGDRIERSIYERYRALQLAAGPGPLRSAAGSPAQRREVLEALKETSPDYAWIGFANSAGLVTAATSRQLEGTNASARNWFRNGRSKPYAGDVRDAPELRGAEDGGRSDAAAGEARVVDLSVPATAPDGQLLGVLGGYLSWGSLATDAVAPLVPAAAARRDHLDLTLYSAKNEVLLDSGTSGWTEPFDAPALPDRRAPQGYFIENTPNGVTFLTGYARSRGYREFRGFGWLAVVRQPVADVFAPAAVLQRRIVEIGAALAAGSALAAGLLAARLTRRLRAIAASAERIREGDILSVLPPPRDRGEISAMCAALGDMVDNFRREQEKLELANARLAARSAAAENQK
ncbi:MAG TPA: HAMP domain-containing protein [Opitutaceae bacterium]|nr:HAMP domain-containing protein [Opitutaceae bacterium]